jgi:hypothetical protein
MCSCQVGLTRCSNQCRDLQNDRNNCGMCGNTCPGSAFTSGCINGMCVCAAGLTMCSGQCINTGFDRNNCGGCGIACSSTQICNNSMCTAP